MPKSGPQPSTIRRGQAKGLLRYGRVEDTIGVREQLDADFQLLIDEYGDVARGSSTYGVLV